MLRDIKDFQADQKKLYTIKDEDIKRCKKTETKECLGAKSCYEINDKKAKDQIKRNQSTPDEYRRIKNRRRRQESN